MLLPSLVLPWQEPPACPWLLLWEPSLSKCQHGAVQGQCLRLLPKTPQGRGQEEREAAHPRISTNCVLWGLTGVLFFSHCVPPNTDQDHSPGSWEPGELLSSGSVHGGKNQWLSWLWLFMTETLEISSPFKLPLLSNFSIFTAFQCENGGIQKGHNGNGRETSFKAAATACKRVWDETWVRGLQHPD